MSLIYQGKDLYICETALADFRAIVNTVGGTEECARAEKLLARVTVIPDHLSDRFSALQISAKIKERAKVGGFIVCWNIIFWHDGCKFKYHI